MKKLYSFFEMLHITKSIPSDKDSWPNSWKTVHYKKYERSEPVHMDNTLLNTLLVKCSEIKKILERRWSGNHFSGLITKEELFVLLSLSSSVRNANYYSRMYPSGGGLYPLEIYYIQNISGEMKSGLYHFSQHQNILKKIRDADGEKKNIFVAEHVYTKSQGYIVVAYDHTRNTMKYGDGGLSLAMIEAGTLLQNISLVASTIGIETRAISGFNYKETDDLLELNRERETAILLICIGKNASSNGEA